MNPLEDDDPLSRRLFLAGTAGAVVAAGTSTTALAQEDEEDGEEEAGEEENGEEADEPAGGGVEQVAVGAGGSDVYEPEELVIEPGTTVEFIWEGPNHNVNPTDQPEDADWEGHPDVVNDPNEYEYTFDVEGTYDYQCDPHVGVGMFGTIIVDPDGAAAGGGGPIDLVPDAAWTLVIATVAGMVSTLSLVYFFMRYGGSPSE